MTITITTLNRYYALSASTLQRVIINRCPFTKAILCGGQYMTLFTDNQRINFLICTQFNASNPPGCSAHGTHIVFTEANGLARIRKQHDFTIPASHSDINQTVTGNNLKRNLAVGTWARKFSQ